MADPLKPQFTFLIRRTVGAKVDYYLADGGFTASPHDGYEYMNESTALVNIHSMGRSDRLHKRPEAVYEVVPYCAELHVLEQERDLAERRLNEIRDIIEAVDNRCMAADGPVTPTLKEMRQEEISHIYELANRKR